MVDGHNAELDVMLRVRLADVYDVEVGRAIAELRVARVIIAFVRGCHPDHVTVRVSAKWLIVKIDVELSQLPQVKGNVFACVGHCAVRAHDDFVGFVLGLFAVGGLAVVRRAHDPAAGELAFRDLFDCAARLQQLESLVPEVQVQHV